MKWLTSISPLYMLDMAASKKLPLLLIAFGATLVLKLVESMNQVWCCRIILWQFKFVKVKVKERNSKWYVKKKRKKEAKESEQLEKRVLERNGRLNVLPISTCLKFILVLITTKLQLKPSVKEKLDKIMKRYYKITEKADKDTSRNVEAVI